MPTPRPNDCAKHSAALPPTNRRRQHIALACACFLAVSAQPASPPPAAPPPDTNAVPMDPGAGGCAKHSAAPVSSEVEALGRMIAEAKQSYQRVRDYSCTFVKQERVGGQLLPEQTAQMTVRAQPFAVHMRFSAPAAVAGQEACYAAGRNNGRMRVKAAGWRGAVGFVTLDLKDPRATRENRHTLAEAGIGSLIDQIARSYELERGTPAQIRFADYKFNNRPCVRVEIDHGDRPGLYCHRCVIFFDRETKLPVRFEAYDRPTAGGPPGGDLLECYNYLDIRFNLNVAEQTFNR